MYFKFDISYERSPSSEPTYAPQTQILFGKLSKTVLVKIQTDADVVIFMRDVSETQ